MGTTQSTSNAAARMMCPFVRAKKTPVRGVVYLVGAAVVLRLDLWLSARLIDAAANDAFKVGVFLLGCVSVLLDIDAAKSAYSNGMVRPVLARLTFLASSFGVFLAATKTGMQLPYAWMTDAVLSAAALLRLYSSKSPDFFSPVFLSAGIVAAVWFGARAIPALPGGEAEEIAQFIKEFSEQVMLPMLTRANEAVSWLQEGCAVL